MDDILAAILVLIILVLATVGTVHLASDFRHFNVIKTQCEKQGYIQDNHTRILCHIEGA